MSDVPFSILARVDRGELVTFIAERSGERLAVDRYNIGSRTSRREVAERWATHPALMTGASFTVEDVERELEQAELRALQKLDANREADAQHKIESNFADDDCDDAENGNAHGPATSELLVRLALEHYRIGVDDRDEAFAVRKVGPNVALMFRGSRDMLRASLSKQFREKYERTPNASALADALTNLQGEALEAKPEKTYLRVAKHCDGVVIDLDTADGRAVVVTPNGWYVIDKSPVLFRRTALSAMLPTPERGGDLRTLTGLLNIPDASWPVVLGWLLATFIPDIPHPILMLGGEAGSGKSTFARMMIGLFDPSSAPLRSQPDDVERWVIAANGSWGVAIDNVSSIAAWWSDSLCKAVTDDGWIRRKLYTDGELAVISFRRVVILTSIDAGALRGDLGDRVLLCDLERISDEQRRGETELNALYERDRPLILGAILDVLVKVLDQLPTIALPAGPRMFDFARVLAAMDKVLGTNALNSYIGQRERIAEDVVEADPVDKAIVDLMDHVGPWSGTAKQLRDVLTVDPIPRDWPGTPRKLSGRLKRIAPALLNLGIEIDRDRKPGGTRDRIITIQRVGGSTVPIVPRVPDPRSGDRNGVSGGTIGNEPGARDDGGNHAHRPLPPFRDDRDGRDDKASGNSEDDYNQRERKAIQAVEAEADAAAIRVSGGALTA